MHDTTAPFRINTYHLIVAQSPRCLEDTMENTVRLRQFEEKDAADLFDWGSKVNFSPAVNFYPVRSLTDAQFRVHAFAQDDQIQAIMVNRHNVGYLELLAHDDGVSEVGLIIDPALRGQGIASAVLKQIIGRHTPIAAVVDRENDPAKALFRKLGFHISAILPSWFKADPNKWEIWIWK
ncbi:GNAT family N-acetyltransferase [Schleiferilactobacillus harbinensis]|nr:GNAT family N-acetyltransferase [Schleiferilactobacillus harbinensis]